MVSLDETAAILTGAHGTPIARYRAAIRLYEFQLAWLFPDDPRTCRAAVQLCTVLFLERAYSDTVTSLGKEPSLKDLSESGEFGQLFDEFRSNLGFRGLRNTRSTKALQRAVKKRLDDAKWIAEVLDFSVRFRREDVKSRVAGGVTSARDYVCFRDDRIKRSRLEAIWAALGGPHAPFLYLINKQEFELSPPRITSRKFSDRLLRQAEDTETLSHFFSVYNSVVDELARKKYSFEKLNSFSAGSFVVEPEPLSVETLSMMRWR